MRCACSTSGASTVTLWLQVPLSSLDLSHVSILYTQGEMAAITPIYDYDFRILHGEGESSWRQLLELLGPPGFVIAALAVLTVAEPRKAKFGLFGDPMTSSRFINPTTRGFNRSTSDKFSSFEEDTAVKAKGAPKAEKAAEKKEGKENKAGNLIAGLKTLVTSRSFQVPSPPPPLVYCTLQIRVSCSGHKLSCLVFSAIAAST